MFQPTALLNWGHFSCQGKRAWMSCAVACLSNQLWKLEEKTRMKSSRGCWKMRENQNFSAQRYAEQSNEGEKLSRGEGKRLQLERFLYAAPISPCRKGEVFTGGDESRAASSDPFASWPSPQCATLLRPWTFTRFRRRPDRHFHLPAPGTNCLPPQDSLLSITAYTASPRGRINKEKGFL
nr:hypothetical protein Iba_chr12dCG19570 [Ipomoea batatas]